MKKVILLVAAMLLTASTGALAADGRAYVGGAAGFFAPDDITVHSTISGTPRATLDTGQAISGFVGYAFDSGLRLEGELSYHGATFDRLAGKNVDSTISATSTMANVYYDMKTNCMVTPFIGGGIGVSKVHVDTGFSNAGVEWLSDDAMAFAYQIGAGAGIEVTKHVTIDVGYRYFATEAAYLNSVKAELKGHNGMVGVRYMF